MTVLTRIGEDKNTKNQEEIQKRISDFKHEKIGLYGLPMVVLMFYWGFTWGAYQRDIGVVAYRNLNSDRNKLLLFGSIYSILFMISMLIVPLRIIHEILNHCITIGNYDPFRILTNKRKEERKEEFKYHCNQCDKYFNSDRCTSCYARGIPVLHESIGINIDEIETKITYYESFNNWVKLVKSRWGIASILASIIGLIFLFWIPLYNKILFLDAERIFYNYGINITNVKGKGFDGSGELVQPRGNIPEDIWDAANNYINLRPDLITILILITISIIIISLWLSIKLYSKHVLSYLYYLPIVFFVTGIPSWVLFGWGKEALFKTENIYLKIPLTGGGGETLTYSSNMIYTLQYPCIAIYLLIVYCIFVKINLNAYIYRNVLNNKLRRYIDKDDGYKFLKVYEKYEQLRPRDTSDTIYERYDKTDELVVLDYECDEFYRTGSCNHIVRGDEWMGEKCLYYHREEFEPYCYDRCCKCDNRCCKFFLYCLSGRSKEGEKCLTTFLFTICTVFICSWFFGIVVIFVCTLQRQSCIIFK